MDDIWDMMITDTQGWDLVTVIDNGGGLSVQYLALGICGH